MRCFAGLPLPPEYQDGLVRLRRLLAPGLRSALSWTRPGNWHLTLKFLGDVDETRLPAVLAALQGLALHAFELQGGELGFFPGSQRPKVLWLGLAQGEQGCRKWAARLEAALAPLGFSPEARPFAPHLTVARVRQAARDDWAEAAARAAAIAWPAVRVGRICLWQSRLTPQGPEYSVLGEATAEGVPDGCTPPGSCTPRSS